MRWGLVAAAIAIAGCYNPNAKTGVPCAANGQCPDGQQCDTTQSPPLCVTVPGSGGSADAAVDTMPTVDAAPACLDNSACAAATAPICDQTSHTCRGCSADAECMFVPGVCVEYTGACVPDAQTIFLSPAPTGVDAGACTSAAPCATFAYAITQVTATSRTIRVGDGSYTEAVDVPISIGTAQLVISGEDKDPATPSITSTANPIFTFESGTSVLLEGMTLTSGPTDGVRMNQVNAGVLSHLIINANGGAGINSLGGGQSRLTVADSQILGNATPGIASQQTIVDLERTLVRGNLGGGMHASRGPFTIINCIFAKNGSASSAVGGLRIDNLNAGSNVQYDTIAYNMAGGTTISPGIYSTSTLTITNLILADNGNAGTAQFGGGLTPTHSLFEGGPTPQGMGNKTGNPAFKDIANGDFHITTGSMAIDQAGGTNVDIDIDGEHRPNGSGPDMGADELY